MKLQRRSDNKKNENSMLISNSSKAQGVVKFPELLSGVINSFKNSDKKQKRAGRNLFVFLIFMLVMTIIARGTTGATLAVVTTEMAYTGEVTKSVKGTSTVKTSEKKSIVVPEGFTVEEVYVKVGDKVKEGDSVLKLDMEELNLQLDKEKVALEDLELKLEKLGQSTEYDNSSLTTANKTLERAREDYSSTKSTGAQNISAAQKKYDTAKGEYEAAQLRNNTAKTEYENAQKSLEELKAATNSTTEVESIDETEEQIKLAEEFVTTKQEEMETAQELVTTKKTEMETAEDTLKETKQQYESDLKAASRAIEDAELTVSSEQKSAANTNQENSNQENQDNVDIKNALLEIDEKKEAISDLESLIQADGEVLSETNGSVKSVIEAGEKTTESAVASISDEDGVPEAEMTLAKEDTKEISVGNKAEIVTGNSGYQTNILNATVTSLSEVDSDGNVTVKLQILDDSDLKQGDSLESRIVVKSDKHSNCIPLSALRSSGSGYYILIVEDKQTVLGTEKILRVVSVTVSSMGDSTAAIEGEFSSTAQIVASSSKEVSEGDRVRLSS